MWKKLIAEVSIKVLPKNNLKSINDLHLNVNMKKKKMMAFSKYRILKDSIVNLSFRSQWNFH